MQTKKIGCKQKTKTCHDANKKDRMQTKKDLQTKRKMELCRKGKSRYEAGYISCKRGQLGPSAKSITSSGVGPYIVLRKILAQVIGHDRSGKDKRSGKDRR